jgi:hypothetical protein
MTFSNSQAHDTLPVATLNDVLPLVDRLSLEDKVMLAERLISQRFSFSELFSSRQSSSAQIDQLPSKQLAELLIAIADRFKREDI